MPVFAEIWNMFICICIMWNSSTFAMGNSTHQLKFLVGCQAVIPCRDYKSYSNSFKWFFKKHGDDSAIHLVSEDTKGIQYYQKTYRPRMSVMHNRSLVISPFREDDQGQYWCQNCYQATCNTEQPISVEIEVLHETRTTFYVPEGSTFTHACPGEFRNLEWTFEASSSSARANPTRLRKSVFGPEAHFATLDNSIHLLNIKRADAGKYTCWTNGCPGQKQKLLTINLCIITVLDHSVNSSASCTAVCDMDISDVKPNRTLNMEAGTWSLSMVVHSLDSLQCNATRKFNNSSAVNSSLGSTNTSNETTEHPAPLILGTSAVCGCLVLLALALFYLRSRQRTALLNCVPHCGTNSTVADETVIYSTPNIRKPETRRSKKLNYDDCAVYSEIKVQRKSYVQ